MNNVTQVFNVIQCESGNELESCHLDLTAVLKSIVKNVHRENVFVFDSRLFHMLSSVRKAAWWTRTSTLCKVKLPLLLEQ